MILRLHADDFGVSAQVNETIVNLWQEGHLNSTSVMVNFPEAQKTFELLNKHSGLKTFLHLNLFEGETVSPLLIDSLFVGPRGRFSNSFLRLFGYYFLNSKRKSELNKQLQAEMRAQIDRFTSSLGSERLAGIDGHCHFHMIPYIWANLIQVVDPAKVQIRFSYEPMWFGLFDVCKNPVGFAKWAVLRLLAYFNQRPRAGSQKYVIGIFESQQLTDYGVGQSLKYLMNKAPSADVEVILHPQVVTDAESKTLHEAGICSEPLMLSTRATEIELLRNSASAWKELSRG